MLRPRPRATFLAFALAALAAEAAEIGPHGSTAIPPCTLPPCMDTLAPRGAADSADAARLPATAPAVLPQPGFSRQESCFPDSCAQRPAAEFAVAGVAVAGVIVALVAISGREREGRRGLT